MYALLAQFLQTDKRSPGGYPKSSLAFTLPSIIHFIHRSYEGFNIAERARQPQERHPIPTAIQVRRRRRHVYLRPAIWFTKHMNWANVQFRLDPRFDGRAAFSIRNISIGVGRSNAWIIIIIWDEINWTWCLHKRNMIIIKLFSAQ